MKEFIKKVIFFLLLSVPIIYSRPIYLLLDGRYQQTVAGNEIYLSINKSKQKSKARKLLIGDSVGKQLFDNAENNDSINSLACNQAIGVVGQYLLLNNYLNSGNKPEVIYLLYNPFSFKNNLDQVFTYHYFLKPFYTEEYAKHFSNTIHEQVNKIPYHYVSREPYILTSNWAPDYTNKDTIDYTFISPISKDYLQRIKQLCSDNNITLYIIPAPTKKSNKKLVDAFNKNEVADLNCKKELEYYLDNIHYLDDSLFIDNVHLKKPKTFTNEVIKWFSIAQKHLGNPNQVKDSHDQLFKKSNIAASNPS